MECTNKDKEKEKEETCPICLLQIASIATIVTKCNHKFCSECLDKWQKQNNSCPCCRNLLTEDAVQLNFFRFEPRIYSFPLSPERHQATGTANVSHMLNYTIIRRNF